MQKSISMPFSIQNWVEENRHLLKPPVANAQIYKGNTDFLVMVVGGPNSRKDFHINQGEELFYQLEGEIELGLMVEDSDSSGKLIERKIPIKAGDLFLLPGNIPHCPRRGPNTVGLVIERYRNPDEMDGFQWYCENCNELLHEARIPVSDIVSQLPVVMNSFFANDELSTCKNCGTKMLPKTV